MDLVSWSLSAIDKIFSSHPTGRGDPNCPDKTLHLFGFMIVGLLLIGLGLFLTFQKAGKSAHTLTKNFTELGRVVRVVKDQVDGLQQKAKLSDEHCAIRIAELQRRLDIICSSAAEMHRKIDDLTRTLRP